MIKNYSFHIQNVIFMLFFDGVENHPLGTKDPTREKHKKQFLS